MDRSKKKKRGAEGVCVIDRCLCMVALQCCETPESLWGWEAATSGWNTSPNRQTIQTNYFAGGAVSLPIVGM